MSPAGTSTLAVRLAIVCVVAAIVEICFVSQVELFGVSADLTPLVVAAVGLLCGALPGAVAGFGLGLFLDLVLFQTLGATSLVLLTVGFAVGRLRETRDPQGALVPMIAGAGATVVALVGYALLQFLLGLEATVSWLLLRETITTVLVNALLAGPTFAVVRRLLVGVLPEDPRRRRRTAVRTSGGLSPLSRA